MSAKDQPQTDQKEYGDVQAAEETQAGLDASAAMEAANAPQVEMPEAEVPQEGPPARATATSVLQQPTNLMQRIPHRYNLAGRPKTETDKAYDIGTLWRVLAADPNAPLAIRAIAQRLMGEA